MTTSDLRINNLILTPKEAGGKPFLRSIVQEIKANSVIVDGEREVKIEDCAGIEINEDWLSGFGFEKGAQNYFNLHFKAYLSHPYCHIKRLGEENELVKIQYVHHLQNLHYTLKGEELTVVSPASAQ